MTADINVKSVARSFFRDSEQPELGLVSDPSAIAAFERAFGMLVKRRKNVVAVPVSEREARGIMGRRLKSKRNEYWLAVGRASPEAGLHVLTWSDGTSGHADAIQMFLDRYKAPSERSLNQFERP